MSDWRERANKRRDERQAKVPVIRPPSGSKKNTRKWCRGKVGVEHKPVCMDYAELKNCSYFRDWKVLVCSECRKELDDWYPSPWFREKREPPAWVTPNPAFSQNERYVFVIVRVRQSNRF